MTPSTQQPQQTKDSMSIGSAESLAPRWVSPGGNTSSNGPSEIQNIHWVGVLRDETMLAEYCNEPENTKVQQMSRRFLKSKKDQGTPPKVDWEFKTYAVQSQRRMVHAVKFCIYEKIPLAAGARAKLVNLKAHTFLNGESVRIIEYQRSTDKYLIRPSIPLPEAQKLATTGMLVVHSKNLVAAEQQIRVWTVAALYNGKKLNQNVACQFLEKILLISENFRNQDEWLLGGEMSAQAVFAPILQSQMAQFDITECRSIDESLEYSKQLIDQNIDIVASQSTSLHAV